MLCRLRVCLATADTREVEALSLASLSRAMVARSGLHLPPWGVPVRGALCTLCQDAST